MIRDREAGLVLPELLVAMVVSTMLLGATLFTFQSFITHSNESAKANDSAEMARATLEIQARQLRNVGKRVDNNDPKPDDPNVYRTGPDDFIFRTSDPTRTWVRYCLDTRLGATRARLWEQTQTGLTPGSGTACPAPSGWGVSKVVGDNIVNKSAGRTVPVFTYRCVDGTVSCTTTTLAFDKIVGVGTQLLVDTTPGKDPAELQVSSGVYLRNQNQAPTAVFTSTPVAGASRTVQLNASSSSDFENRTLSFYWFQGSMPTKVICDKPEETVVGPKRIGMWGSSRFLGRGVVLRNVFEAADGAAGTSQTIGLVACDPGGRYGFVSQTVLIPS